MTWAIRHAIVVNGSGCGGGRWLKSMPPSACTVQQPGTGCQKYSSSERPSAGGTKLLRPVVVELIGQLRVRVVGSVMAQASHPHETVRSMSS